MQATGTLRDARGSRSVLLVALAVVFALALGAAGGYAARSLSPAAGGAAPVQQPAAAPSAGEPVPDSGLIP